MTHGEIQGLQRYSFSWRSETEFPQADEIDKPGVFLVYQNDILFSARPITSLQDHLGNMMWWTMRRPRLMSRNDSFAFLECKDYMEARQKWVWILRHCHPAGQKISS